MSDTTNTIIKKGVIRGTVLGAEVSSFVTKNGKSARRTQLLLDIGSDQPAMWLSDFNPNHSYIENTSVRLAYQTEAKEYDSGVREFNNVLMVLS